MVLLLVFKHWIFPVILCSYLKRTNERISGINIEAFKLKNISRIMELQPYFSFAV